MQNRERSLSETASTLQQQQQAFIYVQHFQKQTKVSCNITLCSFGNMHIEDSEESKAHLGRCHLRYRRSGTDGTKKLNDQIYLQRYRIDNV